MDAGLSYDPDGRIVRYRWYAAGKTGPLCTKRRCAVKVRQGKRRKVKLVVTDNHGARSARTRRINANERPIARFRPAPRPQRAARVSGRQPPTR